MESLIRLKNYLLRGLIACAAILPLLAAEYRGQVKFNGLPLPGATITATQGDKQLSAVSDPQGGYSFPDLPDGTWQLQVEMLGFSPLKQEVTAGTGLPGASFELKMLPLDQIQAEAAAPAPVISSAPAATAAPTAPAVAPPPSIKAANSKAPNGKNAAPAAPASAYQRTDLNGSATPPPASDAAPEVTSELNQRAADGFVVNGSAQNGAASPFAQNPAFGNNRKGGPHLYTGTFSLTESNSSLDAAPFSLTGQSAKTPFNLLTGAFNVGGPIRIPHLLVKPMGQGPMFFLGYQRVENRNSSVTSALMPTAAERTGNFSQALASGQPVQIFNPGTDLPFVNNTIPASLLSPQATALLALFPQPNFAGSSVYNFQVPLIANTHSDSFQLRLNESFKRKNFIQGQISAQNTRSDNNNDFNFLDLTHSLGINSNISYRRSFTPRFYGTVTVTYNRYSTQSFPFFANRENVSGAAGITGNNQQPVNWGPPSLGFGESGLLGLNDANASTLHNQTSGINYLGTWNRGRHNIQFGGDFRWQQFNSIAQANPRGSFSFTGGATQQILNGAGVQGTGFDFADFLLGTPDQSSIAFGNADKYLRAVQPDLSFVDDWKVSPGLTLSLRLEWQYTSPITEKYGRLVNLDVAPGYKAVAPVVASDPVGPLTGMTYPASLIRADKHEFLPKPGFAWRPFPASSMVIKGGYGIGYNTQVYNPFANRMDQQYPLSKSLSLLNSVTPLTLANGFSAPPNVETNTIAVDPNFKIGYAQIWQLSVQRDLPWSLVMLATYQGTKGTHQLQEFVPNTYPLGAANPCSECPSNFVYYTSGGNSTREAGTFDLRRRLHNGIQAEVTYTYSKSIDDAAVLGGGGGSLGSPAQNWLDLEGERGPSTFDQRHLANINLQYTSGMGMGGGTLMSGWRGRLVKDWTVVDQLTLGSGLPLTPVYPPYLISSAGGTERASYTGASLYDALPGYFLNRLALSAPAAGEWGNAGIGSIRGPDQFSMNSSMQRNFRLTDRFNMDLRVDATNSLNRVVFGSAVTTITSQQFGTLTAPNQMRRLTLTLRLHF